MRYVDTKLNKDQLKKCIEKGPYILTHLVTLEVPVEGDNPGQPHVVREETYINTTPENRKLIDAKAEAIYVILNVIGESINKQDVTTKLFWEFGKFTLRDGESIESYYIRFYRMMNEMVRNKLKADTMQMNQHQNEFNETRAKRIARNANPLVLIAATQHYPDDYTQSPKPYKTHAHSSRQTPLTRTHATTRNKGQKIVKTPLPQSESASEEDSDEEQDQRDRQMQKSLALITKHFKNIYRPTNNNLRISSDTKNVDTSLRLGMTDKLGSLGIKGQVNDYEYHKDKMMLCTKEPKGIPLSVEHNEWLQDTDEEPNKQELEAHYMYMARFKRSYMLLMIIQDLPMMLSHWKSRNVIFDSSDMCDNEGKADQNVDEPEDELVLLASLIANLKLDVDESDKDPSLLGRILLPVSLLNYFHWEGLLNFKNDILMFQQHQVQIFYDHVNPDTRRTIDQAAGGKPRDKNAKESWALLEDLALYDNMKVGMAQETSLNRSRQSLCLKMSQICSGPHDTRYCIENLEQAVIDYVSSRTDKAGDSRLANFEADFKQQSEMTNKIDTFWKAINDRMTGALPSDTVKNPKLNVNFTSSVLSARSYPTEDPQSSSPPYNSNNRAHGDTKGLGEVDEEREVSEEEVKEEEDDP
ncbi:hypothetical protein Tco_0759781 [Tanacetum coccineum]